MGGRYPVRIEPVKDSGFELHVGPDLLPWIARAKNGQVCLGGYRVEFLREGLPVVVGALLGLTVSLLASKLKRLPVIGLWAALCPVGGVASSAINGELGGPWQGYFVSFDTLVVTAASLAVVSLTWATRAVRVRR